jgi:hypothetical protein
MRLPEAFAGRHNDFGFGRKGDDMKRVSIVFTLTLITGLWVSSEALACGGRCVNVAAPGSLPCLRCMPDESSPAGCRNDPGACGCYFVPCFGLSQALPEEETALASIFSDDAQPVACSTLPAEIVGAAAE